MTARTKKDDIVYIQRDLEAIKHTLDRILRPYKSDVRNLREENASLRANIARKEQDIESVLRFVVKTNPEIVDDVLTILADPTRRGYKTFVRGWKHRLGMVPR